MNGNLKLNGKIKIVSGTEKDIQAFKKEIAEIHYPLPDDDGEEIPAFACGRINISFTGNGMGNGGYFLFDPEFVCYLLDELCKCGEKHGVVLRGTICVRLMPQNLLLGRIQIDDPDGRGRNGIYDICAKQSVLWF